MTAAVASLGMYDHPAQQWANDALWAKIARRLHDRGIAAPATLDRDRPVEQLWRDPRLIFCQICGYPLVTQPDLALRVVATPHYSAPDCLPGTHVSYLVVRTDDDARTLADCRARTAAINALHSNTDHNLSRAADALLSAGGRFFGNVIETGAHRASLDALLAKMADIAAIDAVTFAAIARYEPMVASALRIIGVTAPSPTLPFVTSRLTPIETVAALQQALAAAMAEPALAAARDALFLSGATAGSIESYQQVLTLETAARDAGYPHLR